MMEMFPGIVGFMIDLAILIGLIVLVVRLVSKGERATSEGSGVFIRRFFLYLVMLVMLALAAVGLAELIDAAAAAGVTRDTTAVARSIAFVLVGLPVYVGLAIYTARRLRDDPREQQSLGWACYLTIALIGSLIAAMVLITTFVDGLFYGRGFDRARLIDAIIWVVIWAGHWWVAQRRGVAPRMQIHLLVGSAAGLIAVVSSAGVSLSAVLQQIYDSLFAVSVVDTGTEAIVRPLISVVVGVPVWWWYWFRHARHRGRTLWWLAYVLLLGILGGVVAVVTGAGFMLFGTLQWILGDPGSTSAVVHFEFLPAALGAVAVGGANWAYHGVVLGDRARRERTEIDRVYDYVLSGAGLLVAAGGLVTLITVVLDAVAGREIASFGFGNALAAAITLLMIGVPLWWRYWSTIRRYRQASPQAELRSATRRIYLFLLFGVTGIVAVINLIVLVFIVFEDILDGTFGSTTIGRAAVPIGLLLAAGALAWYHLTVFREDRAAAPEEERPALREVILVGPDGERLAEAINAHTGATVRLLRVDAGPTAAGTIDDLLEALRIQEHPRVVVVDRDDGYDVLPVEG